MNLRVVKSISDNVNLSRHTAAVFLDIPQAVRPSLARLINSKFNTIPLSGSSLEGNTIIPL